MHIRIDSLLLSKNLKNTIYIVRQSKDDNRSACIYLHAADNRLTIVLTNECDKAIITLPCTILEEGECYVTAHKFVGLLQSFTGQIDLIKGDSTLQIKQGKSRFNLAIFQDGIVDIRPVQFEKVHSLIIDGGKLSNMVSVVTPFADLVSQSVIGGINIQAHDGQIEMRTCHNAAMAICKYKCKTSSKCNINTTLKVQTLQAISKLFTNETITIECTDRLVKFTGETCVIYTRVLYGNFPPIDRLIERDDNCIINIQRTVLEKCLRRVSIVKTLCKQLQLCVDNDILTIIYDNILTESFEINNTDCQKSIVVDYNYIIDVLHVLDNAILNLHITPSNRLMFADDNNIILICPLVQ